MSRRPTGWLVATLFVVAPVRTVLAQASTDPSLVYDKIEAMVPMRDGVRLNTEIYVPKNVKD